MPDFSMCTGVHCPRADSCRRANARANRYGQSWLVDPLNADGSCSFYMPPPASPAAPTADAKKRKAKS